MKSKHIKSKAKTKKLVFLKSTPNSKDISIKLCPDRTCSHPAFVSSLPSGKTMSLKSWQTAAGSWMLCGCFVDALWMLRMQKDFERITGWNPVVQPQICWQCFVLEFWSTWKTPASRPAAVNGEDTSALTVEKERSGKSVSLKKSQTIRFTLSHSSFTNLATSGQLHFVEDYVLSICLDTLQKSMEPAMEWTQPQVQITIRTGCHHDNQHNSWSMSTSGALFKACGCLW